MRILGMTADYVRHDSSVCLVEDGSIVFAASEERFSRLKNDPRAPLNCLEYLLEHYDLTLDDIDHFAVGMPHFSFFKGLPEAGAVHLAQSLLPALKKHSRYFADYARARLSKPDTATGGFEWLPRQRLQYVSHYLSHAASAYRTSGFDKALCVTMDAAGADESGRPLSGSTFLCTGGRLELIEAIPRFSSLGCFYNTVTQAVAFRPVGEDWKLMGLAAFGDPQTCYADLDRLVPRFVNGNWTVSRHTVEAKLIDRPRLLHETELWRILSKLVDVHGDQNVAAAAQRVAEDRLIEYFSHLMTRHRTENLALAGGVFHNIKIIMRLQDCFPELAIYTQPAAGDVGTAMGAALELNHRLGGGKTVLDLQSAALGAEYGESEILGELTKHQARLAWERPENLAQDIARSLAAKQVVGLFQGRAEWGPRALGQRSVIADPREADMRARINGKLKNREWFMPFAPSILEEDGPRYLEGYRFSPFMTNAFRVTEAARIDMPSAIHLDGTARPQIVRRITHPLYHEVISQFKAATGVGAVLNTSFNRHGLPIVNCPADAINHLLWGCIDVLAIGPYMVRRTGEAVAYRQRLSHTVDEIIGKWEPFDERMLKIRQDRAGRAPD